MSITIGKAHNFVFDRWAISWPDPFDDPGIHRATIQIITDHIMSAFVGMRDVTRHLFWVLRSITHKREYRRRIITILRC